MVATNYLLLTLLEADTVANIVGVILNTRGYEHGCLTHIIMILIYRSSMYQGIGVRVCVLVN